MSSPVGSWVDIPCENQDAAPSIRYYSACAVYKDSLYVFGGRGTNGCQLNDFHEFSFLRKRWRAMPVKPGLPSAREGHTCLVYNDALYVFGGYDGRSYLNDLVEFSFLTQQWTVVAANSGSAPTPRAYHSAVIYGKSMYIFGGYPVTNNPSDRDGYNVGDRYGKNLSDRYGYNDGDHYGKNMHGTHPFNFNNLNDWHSYNVGDHYDADDLNDIHLFNVNNLNDYHSANFGDDFDTNNLYDIHQFRMSNLNDCRDVDVGGRCGTNNKYDIYAFNFDNRAWTPVRATGSTPQVRHLASVVVVENLAILFGGYCDSGYLNDMHMFSFDLCKWATDAAEGSAPSPRAGHVAVLDQNGMYVFGGYGSTEVSDFHKLTLEPNGTLKWHLITSKGAPPRVCAYPTAAVYKRSLIVFGDQGNGSNFTQFRITESRRFASSTGSFFGDMLRRLETAGMAFLFSPRMRETEVNQRRIESSNGVAVRSDLNQSRIGHHESTTATEVRSDPNQSRIEQHESANVTEVRNELNQLRNELREDAETLRAAVLHESAKLCKRLMTETVTQLAELQVQAEQLPAERPVDSHLKELCTCPISLDIMKDPVLTPSGVTYERAMIEQHLDRVGAFDPTTNVPLKKAELYPNRAIKDLVEKHFSDQTH